MDDLIREFATIIGQMPPTFTSHTFILALAQDNQRAYVEALNQYVAGDAPFQTLHAQISQSLYKFPALVDYIGEVDSLNIFGRPGRCAQWQRK